MLEGNSDRRAQAEVTGTNPIAHTLLQPLMPRLIVSVLVGDGTDSVAIKVKE